MEELLSLNKKENNKKKVSPSGLAFFLFLFLGFNFYSQPNLLPNGSFEDTISCPNFAGQLQKSKYWYNPNSYSPDYLNSCSSNWGAGVPNNGNGFQQPRTGSAYAGFYVWETLNNSPSQSFREYVQTFFVDTLMQNKTYCIKLFLNLSNTFAYASSKIQCYLSANQVSDFSGTPIPLPYTPQFQNTVGNFISDTVNWTEVNGIYTATGGEKWITIGNFYDYNNSDSLLVDITKAPYSYYFIDDVSIVEVSPAFAGNDTTFCTQQSVQVGSAPTFGADYSWTQIKGSSLIDSSTIAQPHIVFSTVGDTSVFVMQKTQCSVITYDTVQIIFKSCVGIEENNFAKSFSVYPNPANDEIIVLSKQNENFSVSIKDISGREAKNFSFLSEEKNILKTNNLENGIYILSVKMSEEKQFIKKIVVQH